MSKSLPSSSNRLKVSKDSVTQQSIGEAPTTTMMKTWRCTTTRQVLSILELNEYTKH